MDNAITISSWSGGKDSCLACYKAMKAGLNIRYLLNFVSGEYKRSCFHGIEAKLLELQTGLTGIPIFQKDVGPSMEEYEREFKAAVTELKAQGAKIMVFGDIYLDEHRQWVERVCNELEIEPLEPLWGIAPDKILEDFIDSGFKAVVVSCQAKLFDSSFIGRYIDKNLLNELKDKGICPCGENGEFHTFVIDGPIFKKRIEISKSQTVLKGDFWKYWFLDIEDYKIISK